MKKKILVTGGCGYIGSHTIVDLVESGYEVVCVDSLINSEIKILDGIHQITGAKIQYFNVDLADAAMTNEFFDRNHDFDGIIHFAALKSVPESVREPLLYYRNNVNSLLNILENMVRFSMKNLIFSSSCSVYGNTKQLPVLENTPFEKAQSPYAYTKQIGETLIEDFITAYSDFSSILLRYFNPAGAHESAKIGELPLNPATSLVPVITETAIGKRKSMSVFGSDYDTRDGSCIRDYIHVTDLAHAHTLAIKYLLESGQKGYMDVFNLGIGEGATVFEAINAFESTSGVKLDYSVGPRRQGDVVAIYANHDKATEILGWKPVRNIGDIMRSAWNWEKVRSEY